MPTRHIFSSGSHVLHAKSYQEQRGRDLVELLPAAGPGGQVLDSGPARRQFRATITWLPTDADPSPLTQRDNFLATIATGESQLLIHPIDGGVYLAKVGEHTESIGDPTNEVIDNVTFVEDRSSDFSPQPVGAGVEPSAGAQSVKVAASEADAALSSLALESSEPQAAADLADEWATRSAETNTVVDARRVQTERDQRLTAIDAEIVRLELTERNDRYAAYQGLISVATALRKAAAAATQATSRTQSLTLAKAIGLRALAASIDPDNAAIIYDGIRALNRIDSPLVIPAGTVLRIPLL